MDNATIKSYEDFMIKSRPIIDSFCQYLYGSNDTKQLRKDYRSGSLKKRNYPKELEFGMLDKTLVRLIEIQDFYVRKYKNLIYQIGRKYSNTSQSNSIDLDDLVQEGFLTLCDCVFKFNGSYKFITYVYVSVRNNMRNMLNSSKIVFIPKDIMILRNMLEEIMFTFECTLDEAFEKTKMTPKQIKKCMSNSFNVIELHKPLHPNGIDTQEYLLPSYDEQDDDAIMLAFDTSNLSKFESDLVIAYCKGNIKGFRSAISKKHNKSRAAAAAAFDRAIKKIGKSYFDILGEAA